MVTRVLKVRLGAAAGALRAPRRWLGQVTGLPQANPLDSRSLFTYYRVYRVAKLCPVNQVTYRNESCISRRISYLAITQ